jgi:predicted DNA-binding protein
MNKKNNIQSESVRLRVSKSFQINLKQIASKRKKSMSRYIKDLVEADIINDVD